MFAIEYEILDDERKRLSNIKNAEEIELDFNNVIAKIQLVWNNRKIGFVNKEIPYDGEIFLTWLQRLNKVIIQLKTNIFVAMLVSDSSNMWLEFKSMDKMILVTKIKAKEEMHIQESIVNAPKETDECFWSEYISRKEFVNGIFVITSRVIKDINSINKLFLETREVVELKKYFKKQKSYWRVSSKKCDLYCDKEMRVLSKIV